MSTPSGRRRPAPPALLLPLLLLLLSLAGCGGGGGGGGTEPDPITRVEVTGPGARVAVHETLDLAVNAYTRSGKAAAGSSTVWRSDRTDVAEVSVIGEVTGKAEGTATISCTIDGVTGSMTVTVTRAAVSVVTITPDTATLVVGTTRAFTVTPRDLRGQPVTGLPVSWGVDNPSVVTVTQAGAGWVLEAKQVGQARVTATVDGRQGSATVTVVPVPVASVTISPASVVLEVGQRQTFTTTLRDAAGNVLAGRTVQWSSLDGGVAFPVGVGLVEAVAPGNARIVARVEGKADTAHVNVPVPVAARVEINPRYVPLGVGETTPLSVSAFSVTGTRIPSPVVVWSTPTPGATVSAAGVVGAATPGVYRAVARVDQATDTATFPVLGARSLLSTAFGPGAPLASVRPGQLFEVPVVLHTSRVSANGDVGSAQFELRYDPEILRVDSVDNVGRATSEFNTSTPGVVRFAMISRVPHGGPQVLLATVRFRVAANAPVSAMRRLELVYTARPSSLSFELYELPLTVGGTLRIIAP